MDDKYVYAFKTFIYLWGKKILSVDLLKFSDYDIDTIGNPFFKEFQ